MKSKESLNPLIELFDPHHEGPQLSEMPESFSRSQLIKWLHGKTKQFTVDRKKLQQLEEEGRLIPDVGFNRFSNIQVLQYYLETKPR